jgi:hypothetical protein
MTTAQLIFLIGYFVVSLGAIKVTIDLTRHRNYGVVTIGDFFLGFFFSVIPFINVFTLLIVWMGLVEEKVYKPKWVLWIDRLLQIEIKVFTKTGNRK